MKIAKNDKIEAALEVQRIFSLLFGFESGDDRTVKTLKVFAGVAQVLFVIMFFVYCFYSLRALK